MKVYIDGQQLDDSSVSVPLSSSVIVFLLNYCKAKNFRVLFVDYTSKSDGKCMVKMDTKCLQSLDYDFIGIQEAPVRVTSCALPVIEDEHSMMIRCGLCCVARYIIKISHEAVSKHTGDTLIDLLGFRAGSLKACSEVSGWTKLCEIELLESISALINNLRQDSMLASMELPEDVMKLELHFDTPPSLHNDDKKKRLLLKSVKRELDNVLDPADERTVVGNFFASRQGAMPHGNISYRVVTQEEKEGKKYVNSENGMMCKYGCSENKLVKWCAKCNDREKLRRKLEKQQRNNARLIEHVIDDVNIDAAALSSMTDGEKPDRVESDAAALSSMTDGEKPDRVESGAAALSSMTDGEKPDRVESGSRCGIKNIAKLCDFVNTLTLNDIVYEHVYAEGLCFTIADIMLYVYIYHLMETLQFRCSTFLQKLPNVKKWLTHILTLPRMQHASYLCGFNMAALMESVKGDEQSEAPDFTIPTVTLNVEEDSNEISRSTKAKHKALKHDLSRVLQKVKDHCIYPVVGDHPKGDNVQVDWSTVPLAAHPRIELPEKRVARKCEQLENLATAVQAIARPGDVVVDFCSGAGHLGIIIAYLLPDCQVYLIENKEESLVRANNRVKQLGLQNVVLYQCNLDYFQGQFDIGVCLHACGVATDLVLQQCLDKKASFVICPCCYGSIQNTHLISYPRSQHYREAGLNAKDVIILGHAADQTEENTELVEQGRRCMNLVDTDRAKLAVENGYDVTLCSLKPPSCTPKNNILIGTISTL